MATSKSEEVRMLEVLIESATAGKHVDLNVNPVREVIRIDREDQKIDMVVLSMEYSGTIDGEPFKFKKGYSFAEDEAKYAFQCLLIANNRLQIDYDRLKEAGINTKDDFFTFQNSFLGLPGDASLKSPALRLQSFIHLARTGAPVSVDVSIKSPTIILKQEDAEKEGFGCIATFVFNTEDDETTIEKLYSLGSYDDTKEYQAEVKNVANRRLERDCERLRRAGMDVDRLSF